MQVPVVDLNAQNDPLRVEIMCAITKVLDSGEFILGPKVQEFEAALSGYLGIKYVLAVKTCTDATLMALMALGVGPGDYVFAPAFACYAAASGIIRLGAQPIFVDIDPLTFNISPSKLRERWRVLESPELERVRAIIAVGHYGQSADMQPILEFATLRGIAVVEDAAQAFGAEYRHGQDIKKAGTMGTMGVFSFLPIKNLGGVGDGGAIATNDSALAEKLSMIRCHGSKTKHLHEIVGGNFRLDSLKSAVLLAKLKYLDRWNWERQIKAQVYHHLLGGLKEFILLPHSAYESEGLEFPHVFNRFVIRAKKRDQLKEFLDSAGIQTTINYPLPLSLQPCFSDLGHAEGDFPESERAAREVLTLPFFPEITVAQQEFVAGKIVEFYEGGDSITI